MKKLRNRQRPDRLETDLRSRNRSIGRKIYLALLILFVLGIANYFFGDRVFLRATGVVLKDRIAIDATKPTLIAATYKREGDAVKRGEPIFDIIQLERPEFSAGETGALLLSNEELIAIKTEICAEPAKPETQIDSICMIGETELSEKVEALAPAADTAVLLDGTTYSATETKAQELRFTHIQITANVDGTLGNSIGSSGHVFVQGETMAELYHGDSYVLVYLPETYRFGIKEGDRVVAKYGATRVSGSLQNPLAVSGIVPAEFHNSIRAVGRNRLVRMSLDNDGELSLLQDVDIRGMRSGILKFFPF